MRYLTYSLTLTHSVTHSRSVTHSLSHSFIRFNANSLYFRSFISCSFLFFALFLLVLFLCSLSVAACVSLSSFSFYPCDSLCCFLGRWCRISMDRQMSGNSLSPFFLSLSMQTFPSLHSFCLFFSARCRVVYRTNRWHISVWVVHSFSRQHVRTYVMLCLSVCLCEFVCFSFFIHSPLTLSPAIVV